MKYTKHIYIIGYGVIAKALSVALVLNGREVTIIRGSSDGEPAHQELIRVTCLTGTHEAKVTVSTFSQFEKLDGIIVLTNKSFGNADIAEKLCNRSINNPIIFLQNGLHIEKSFQNKGFNSLYRCVLYASSQSHGKNGVELRVAEPSAIGIIEGDADTLEDIVTALHTEMFPFCQVNDIHTLVWKKVISNCVFNSICPLLEIDNGIFHKNAAAMAIANEVIAECMTVVYCKGINLTKQEVLDNVIMISTKSDGQQISTYQDILNKRETEIETLNLEVAETGGSYGLSLPVTSLLGELTKLKSEIARG